MKKENIVLALLIAMLGLMIWNVIIIKEIYDHFPDHDQLRGCRMFVGFGAIAILQGIALLIEREKFIFFFNAYLMIALGISMIATYYLMRNWYIVHGF